MPKPKLLTLAQVEKLARKTDPDAWEAMSPKERQRMVDDLNKPFEEAQHRAAMAKFEENMDKLLGRKRR